MNTSTRRALGALFFIYSFGMMSWLPRFPEVKANLGVSNGQFGTLLSFTAVGSIISLFTVGQFVNRFGSRRVMTVSATLMYGSIFLVVHLHSPWQFLLCNITLGLGVSGFHSAINGQALHEQKPQGENLINRFHGLWSLGALTTAILSGLLAGKISLVMHIDLVALFVYTTILLLLRFLGSTLLPPNASNETLLSISRLFKSFNLDWKMAVGFTCAVALEFSMGDWSAIFSKEELHMSPGVSVIPNIVFMIAMIGGRLTVHRLTDRRDLSEIIRQFVIVGGMTFAALLVIGIQVSQTLPLLGFLIIIVGSFIGGLGSSFLAPTIMDAANRRAPASGAVVVGQLGVVYTGMIFILKSAIAWTAQVTSVGVALLIPSALLISVAFFARSIEEAQV